MVLNTLLKNKVIHLIGCLSVVAVFAVGNIYGQEVQNPPAIKPLTYPEVVVTPKDLDKSAYMAVEVTAYTAAEDECGRPVGDPDFGRTASGEFVRRGFIAVDPSVIPLHSKVRLTGLGKDYDGIYLAKDTGGAIVGNRIDIYVSTKSEAWNFGRRRGYAKVED